MDDVVAEFTVPVEPQRRFKLVRFDEIKLPTDPAYLVKGLIPREGLCVVWGPPKCGKSFWIYDAMMHVACDWEYRGRKVNRGSVVYVACEGERGLGARTEAYRQKTVTARADFYLLTTRLDLIGEHETLIADIAAQVKQPVAVVIDTLNRSLRGSESRDEDMGDYLSAADAIREAFACTVIMIHHCGIEGSRPRGHTSLTGACDAQIAVKKGQDGTVTCLVEYMKDGPEGDEFHSKLEPVEVGIDDDGDAISSCVIIEAEQAEHSGGKKLSARMQRGLDALNNCIIEHGQPAPDAKHYPDSTRVVSLDLWREALFSSGVLDKAAANPRADFKRLKDGLADRGAAREWNGLIWPV